MGLRLVEVSPVEVWGLGVLNLLFPAFRSEVQETLFLTLRSLHLEIKTRLGPHIVTRACCSNAFRKRAELSRRKPPSAHRCSKVLLLARCRAGSRDGPAYRAAFLCCANRHKLSQAQRLPYCRHECPDQSCSSLTFGLISCCGPYRTPVVCVLVASKVDLIAY